MLQFEELRLELNDNKQKLGLNLAARNGHAAVAHSIVSGGRAGIAAKEIEHIAVPVPQELHIIAVLRRVKLEIRIAVPRKRERFNGAFFSVYSVSYTHLTLPTILLV